MDFEDRGGGLDGPSGVVISKLGFGFRLGGCEPGQRRRRLLRRQGAGPRVDARSTP
jgi:hypothetical protein